MQKEEIVPDCDTQEVEKHAECGIREEETANHRGRGMEGIPLSISHAISLCLSGEIARELERWRT